MDWLKSDYFRIEMEGTVSQGVKYSSLKSDYFRIEIY